MAGLGGGARGGGGAGGAVAAQTAEHIACKGSMLRRTGQPYASTAGGPYPPSQERQLAGFGKVGSDEKKHAFSSRPSPRPLLVDPLHVGRHLGQQPRHHRVAHLALHLPRLPIQLGRRELLQIVHVAHRQPCLLLRLQRHAARGARRRVGGRRQPDVVML